MIPRITPGRARLITAYRIYYSYLRSKGLNPPDYDLQYLCRLKFADLVDLIDSLRGDIERLTS